jgi:hypothetical protein
MVRSRTIVVFIVLLLVLPLFWSCQNPAAGMTGEDPLVLANKLLAAQKVRGPVTAVPCPNDPAVDSGPCIQMMLEAAAPGGTVKLEAGTYYLATPILVDTAFNGALRGAGRDKTFIKVMPGATIASSSFAKIEPVFFPHPGFASPAPVFFNFQIPKGEAASISMSDFSIIVTDPAPGAWEGGSSGPLMSLITVNATSADTTFERLRLVGAEFGEQAPGVPDHNVWVGIHLFGCNPEFMSGSHVLKDCVIEHVNMPYNPFLLRDGTITVSDNRFISVSNGMYLEDFSNCTATVTGNVVSGVAWTGVTVLSNNTLPPEKPSRFLVRANHIASQPECPPFIEGILVYDMTIEGTTSVDIENNEVRVSGCGDGIYLFNWVGTHTVHARITGNNIVADLAAPPETGLIVGGIGEAAVQEAVVTGNRISGSAVAGIYVGVYGLTQADPTWVSEGWLIKGNNVNNITTSVAPIWLGVDSYRCTVIGSNAKTNVLDQGTENVITGMKRITGDPPGPRIKDALQHMREMKGFKK